MLPLYTVYQWVQRQSLYKCCVVCHDPVYYGFIFCEKHYNEWDAGKTMQQSSFEWAIRERVAMLIKLIID